MDTKKIEICCIFNIAAHYRAPIYELMDSHLNCDFYLGDKIHTPLKKMEYLKLKGFKKELSYKKLIGNFYWQQGAINNVFKPYKIYILIGEPYCISTWIILILTKFTKKRTFLWSHGWYGNEGKLKSGIKRIFFKMSSRVLLYGNHSRNLMVKHGFDGKKLCVIFNSLDYDKQKKIRNELHKTNICSDHFKNQDPVLIYTGRLIKIKKLDLLIKAHSLLHEKGININVLILGDGEEKLSLEKLVENHKLSDKYWFYGACYDEKLIAQFYNESIVCVSPGNVGLTAIHSLTYGTPVITHNNFWDQMPEFEAISDGNTGGFFKENDPYDLAIKITDWILISENDKMKTRNEAYNIIDTKYNPHYQMEVLNSILHNNE